MQVDITFIISRRDELKRELDSFVQQANAQIAAYQAVIGELDRIIAREAEDEKTID